jgi:Carbohydrate family 9 binding domain-like
MKAMCYFVAGAAGTTLLSASLLVPATLGAQPWRPASDSPPALRYYVAHRAPQPIRIDGILDELSWEAASWTEAFVDIATGGRVRLATRVKMLWDESSLYVAALLEEPDVWATLVTRDTVIFLDNDFEVFLDPDGDTHHYYEFEINALGTEWDLLLRKPYRDGGPAVTSWDMVGLRTAVHIDGTINDPSSVDRGWTVEMAIPFAALDEYHAGNDRPHDGDQWRVNFSRVEWPISAENGGYRKLRHASADDPHPEANWVWSPQGAINMHLPEMWGVVQFSTATAGATIAPRPLDDADVRWTLRRVYYAQRVYHLGHGRYASRVEDLAERSGQDDLSPVRIDGATPTDYRATAMNESQTARFEIRADGRIRRLPDTGE